MLIEKVPNVRAGGILIAGACVFLVAFCGDRNPAVPGETLLRIGVGLGASARGAALYGMTELLYAEPLIALDANGRPTARLAESWQWGDDRKALRVVLRNGIKLHDGQTLDAEAARSFLLSKIEELRTRRSHHGSFDRVKSIVVEGDRTLVVHLAEPDAFLIPEFNNADIVNSGDSDIGTGPFRLRSRDPLIADRFEQYHRGVAAIKEVRIVGYESQRAAWAALMRNEVDAVQEVNRESVEFLERTTGLQVLQSLRPYYWALSFNLRHPGLRNPEVRRALNKAVNRDEIVASVLRGHAMPATDPVWPLHWAYTRTPDHHEYDPRTARELLHHARVAMPGGRGLRFRCLFYGEDPLFERIAMMVQRQLNEVGVEVELQPASFTELTSKIATGEFDSFLMQTASGRALDWTYRFWRSPRPGEQPLQSIGYTGADTALDELKRAYTDEETRAGVSKLRKRFFEDPPAVFIAWQRVTRVVSSRFDISEADEQDVFANIWQWKPASGPK